ncbi:MAG: hypothetical protein JW900_11490 [Anaerolineae bacterium]|nr:hypothetical protein [Anaerolineae bacterium]
MKRRALRYGPLALAALVALLGLRVSGFQVPGRVEPETWNLKPAAIVPGGSFEAGSRPGGPIAKHHGALSTGELAGLLPLAEGGAAVQEGECEAVNEMLLRLSEQAAVLTGGLAMVDAEERALQAHGAAWQVRILARRAAHIARGTPACAGDELGGVLADLADALADYAAGDATALVRVQAASARNAALREQYTSCAITQYAIRNTQYVIRNTNGDNP